MSDRISRNSIQSLNAAMGTPGPQKAKRGPEMGGRQWGQDISPGRVEDATGSKSHEVRLIYLPWNEDKPDTPCFFCVIRTSVATLVYPMLYSPSLFTFTFYLTEGHNWLFLGKDSPGCHLCGRRRKLRPARNMLTGCCAAEWASAEIFKICSENGCRSRFYAIPNLGGTQMELILPMTWNTTGGC